MPTTLQISINVNNTINLQVDPVIMPHVFKITT